MELRSLPIWRHRLWLSTALFIYLATTLPSWLPRQIYYSTLDGAYQAVLNLALVEGWQFGSQINTTTGPLGFLRNPKYWPGTDGLRILWAVTLAAVFAIAAGKLAQGLPRPMVGLCAGASLLLLFQVNHEYWVLLPLVGFVFLFVKAIDESSRLTAWEVLFAFALAVSSWILFTELLAGLITISGVTLIHGLRHRRVSGVPLVFVAALVLLWTAAGQRVTGIANFLENSLQVATGYNDVMVRYCGWWEPTLILVGFAAVLVTVLWYSRGTRYSKASLVLVAHLMLTFFVAFKSAFTRCQISRSVVIAALLGWIATASLAYLTRVQGSVPRGSLATVVYCLLVTVGFTHMQWREQPPLEVLERLALQPLRQVGNLVARARSPELLTEARERDLSKVRELYPLPDLDGGVDWFGDRQGILLAHGLDFRPRPIFQRFTAYTPRLARANAEFLAGPSAADWVVVDFNQFSNFPLALLDSLSFLELLSTYEADRRVGEFLILKRASRRSLQLTRVFETTVPVGQFVRVGRFSRQKPLWVEIDVRRTMLGRLSAPLLKLPGVWIDLKDAAGKLRRFRFAENPARTGFLLSPQLLDAEQIYAYMHRDPSSPPPTDRIVTRFRLFEKAWARSRFRSEVRVRVFEVDWGDVVRP